MVIVKFHGCGTDAVNHPTYAVIGARYGHKWVFVSSRKRGSLEMPAGHIGEDENPDFAAGRELSEETGARKFIIECVDNYSVEEDGIVRWGKLFLATIISMGEIIDKDEIESVSLLPRIPAELSFPEVQSRLFERVSSYLE